MNTTTQLGLGVLGTAGVLGLLGDALLRATPWGLNAFLWIAALVLAAMILLRRWPRPLAGEGRWLVPAVLFFAATLSWRDSAVLKGLSILAVLVSLALAAFRLRSGSIRIASIGQYAWALCLAGVHAIVGFLVLLFGDIRWNSIPRDGWMRQALAVGRGFAIAFPLIFIFGGLFVAADAVFEHIVADLFDWDVEALVTHSVWTAFWAWIVGGFLRQVLLERDDSYPSVERPAFTSLGLVEIGIVLGALNLLFLAFVLVQFRYFFGGAALVEASTGMSYADYARRGFFELVAVAALVLPLLLSAHWLLRTENRGHERLFRILASGLIVLLFVIMASAVQRMRLYQQEFGLTELRLYTTAFMGWLAVVFLWFGATVLRGRRDHFVFGALFAGFLAIALLHLLNPDALIVRTNVARVNAPQPLDRRYITTLSADAVPALVTGLPSMSAPDRCWVAAEILEQWSASENPDWRTWNWSRVRAWRTVGAQQQELQSIACPD